MDLALFDKLGASLLDRTICATAGGYVLAATYGGKVGMHLEHYADSKLIVIWGSNSIASNLHFWTFAQKAKREGAKLICIDPAQDRNGRQVPPAHRPAARHRWRAGARPDARADRKRLARPRLHRAPHRRLAPAPRAGPAVDARAHGRGLRHHGRRSAWPGRVPCHHEAGRDSPQLRHAARARRRQCGAAGGDPALPHRCVAASGGWPAAVGVGLVPAQHRGAAASRADGRAQAAHDQHEHDR